MSSGDALLHAAASIGIRDGLAKLMPGRLDDRGERRAIRILVILVAAISYFFAVTESGISLVGLLLGSYGGVAQIFPLVIAAFYWPRANGPGALAGLLGGIAVNTFFLVLPQLKPWPMHEGVYGLAANLLLLITVSLATRPEPAERVGEYAASGG